MSTVIRIENLSKRYRLGEINRKLLYEEVQRRWAKFRGKSDPTALVTADAAKENAPPKEIWALQDLNFEIKDGDVVGIIGRNGSGKSTLLKILSSITGPTTGRVMLKGRVASLLEVGTGFHPELTGRENVFLNGSILGMTDRELRSKFDEIVAFAGVEKFMDTPVKRYSSGMQVRLAFAVAAHLDPEILIIDEVLAVGDSAFQQKCLGKISSVAKEGRTVLFVSHNAAAVQNLCTRGIVLENGRMKFDGTQTAAIEYYADSLNQTSMSLRDRRDRTGNGDIRIVEIEFRTPDGKTLKAPTSGQDVDICLHFENHAKRAYPASLNARIQVATHYETPVFMQHNALTSREFGPLPEKGCFVCRIPRLPLPPSHYRLSYFIASAYERCDYYDCMFNAVDLPVEAGDYFGSGELPSIHHGVCLVEGEWRVESSMAPVVETVS